MTFLSREEFLKTELGMRLVDCLNDYSEALDIQARCIGFSEFNFALRKAEEKCRRCQAQLEVYKTVIKQLCGIECHYTITENFVGIAVENDGFLVKVERKT